jgi:uncharacterized protein YjbI with pentapeptide repeats
VTLSRATLNGATLNGATLIGVTLSRGTLSRATGSRATLSGATLSGATPSEATPSGKTPNGATPSKLRAERLQAERLRAELATIENYLASTIDDLDPITAQVVKKEIGATLEQDSFLVLLDLVVLDQLDGYFLLQAKEKVEYPVSKRPIMSSCKHLLRTPPTL